ncbi:MAG: MvdC/MvdD family ATP grasp protein [Acidimicrobiales bacterium]
MILAVTHPDDVHAHAVLAELARLGATAVVVDLSRFPAHAGLSLGYGGAGGFSFEAGGGPALDLDQVEAVWWRRPQPFTIDGVGGTESWQFAYAECQEAFDGLWYAIGARLVNHPALDQVAHKKSLQLRVAEALGLAVPPTLVTNDPARAADFAANHGPGGTVYKPFQATERQWRETRLLRDGELALLDQVRHAPVIFQRYVAGTDIRVTIVGERLFPAAIDVAGGSYPVDFRFNHELRITETELPGPVSTGLLALMDNLGLVFGAVDLRRTPDGDHFFLEVNPAGQWLFVEDKTAQPISRALAEVLVGAAR